jgi:hypothetical protein
MWVWVVLFFFAIPSAWACSCSGWPSAKGAWENSPVVFLGHVERTEQEFDKLGISLREDQRYSGRQTAWVKVDEAFKGVEIGSQLRLEQAGHNCAPKFRAGEQVVFYLHPEKEPGVWVAYGCHRTRVAEKAADDLLFLRALPRAASRSRLSGEVELYEDAPDRPFHRVRGLSGIPIRIRSGDRLIETVTNADGVYEVYDLPPGTYRVEVDLPKEIEIHFPILTGVTKRNGRDKGTEVSLATSAGVSVSFVVMERNAVSGRLVDPEGKPLAGVPVSLEPVGGLAPSFRPPESYTEKDGTFEINQFPSGEYLLVANRSETASGQRPFGPIYFPGTDDRQQARVIKISAGQPVEDLTLRIPKLKPTITVSGQVQFSDGKPASQPWLYAIHGDRKEQLFPGADGDGRFRIPLLAGQPVRLQAVWTPFTPRLQLECLHVRPDGPYPYRTGLKSPEVPVSAAVDQTGLVLTLPAPSCKSQ